MSESAVKVDPSPRICTERFTVVAESPAYVPPVLMVRDPKPAATPLSTVTVAPSLTWPSPLTVTVSLNVSDLPVPES